MTHASVDAITVVLRQRWPVAEKRRTRRVFATALKARPVAESAILAGESAAGLPFCVYQRWVRAGMS